MQEISAWKIVQELLQQQSLGVLGTSRQGHSYTSLVAFVAQENGAALYFATSRTGRKYSNLVEDERVALLIDNRTSRSQVLFEAAAVTAYGRAGEVSAAERDAGLALYRTKHPQLDEFVMAPTTALVQVTVESYQLVRQFEQVIEFRLSG
jgi:nitroimidazol reductase NimA-like FMN-containing flavoprotein (pyridoxamine 5'-phosphate oxidase superfamily)